MIQRTFIARLVNGIVLCSLFSVSVLADGTSLDSSSLERSAEDNANKKQALQEKPSIESLLEQDRLRIEAHLSSPNKASSNKANSNEASSNQTSDAREDLIVDVRQPVTLTITVATDRWFAGGSRIAPFAIKDVVIPKVSDLVINSTQRINGATWASQTREIILYPNRAGRYLLPPVRVTVSVNTEQGPVSGSVAIGALGFQAILPQALKGIDTYLVSEAVELSVEGEFDPDGLYRVGDAVTQTISLKADSVPAMMLPEFTTPKNPGLSIYQKPAQVFDRANRGSLTGHRIEARVYTLSAKGDFSLPAQSLYWWNPKNQELTELTIPEQRFRVERAAFSWQKIKAYITSGAHWPSIFFGLVAAVSVAYLGYRARPLIPVLTAHLQRRCHWQKRQDQRSFLQAIAQKNYPKACQLLYRLHQLPEGDIDNLRVFFVSNAHALALLGRLYGLAYGNVDSSLVFSAADAKELISAELGHQSEYQQEGIDLN